MSVAYNFHLSNRTGPVIPHLLTLLQSERTGRFTWAYFKIQGKIVPAGQKPEASGEEVRYGTSGAVFELYAGSNYFGTLTIRNKSYKFLAPGDEATFRKFTGGEDNATFTGRVQF